MVGDPHHVVEHRDAHVHERPEAQEAAEVAERADEAAERREGRERHERPYRLLGRDTQRGVGGAAAVAAARARLEEPTW